MTGSGGSRFDWPATVVFTWPVLASTKATMKLSGPGAPVDGPPGLVRPPARSRDTSHISRCLPRYGSVTSARAVPRTREWGPRRHQARAERPAAALLTLWGWCGAGVIVCSSPSTRRIRAEAGWACGRERAGCAVSTRRWPVAGVAAKAPAAAAAPRPVADQVLRRRVRRPGIQLVSVPVDPAWLQHPFSAARQVMEGMGQFLP